MMENIRRWLEGAELEYGQPILAIVVGEHEPHPHDFDESLAIYPLSRKDGLAKLDEEFESNGRQANCFPFFAWTEDRVFFIHEYNGQVALNWIPRNPTASTPEFNGTYRNYW